MTKPGKEIVVVDGGYESYGHERKSFAASGYRLVVAPDETGDRREKLATARNAVGILVRGTQIDARALDRMPSLRAIVRYGVGYENIDLEAAMARGIRVANIQGYANHAVSDHALALMLACVRNLTGAPMGPFGKPARKEVFELHDKTLGIIGIGRIGSHFSMKASPLFHRTLAYDPYQEEGYMSAFGAVKTGFGDLLSRSHVISLHCNLTGETRYILDKDAIRQMEQRPVVINTSRGAVIREHALLQALDSFRVHSAGLDVFEEEPPGTAQAKLLSHPRVVATPHVAWYSLPAMESLHKRAAANMLALLSDGETEDEITI